MSSQGRFPGPPLFEFTRKVPRRAVTHFDESLIEFRGEVPWRAKIPTFFQH